MHERLAVPAVLARTLAHQGRFLGDAAILRRAEAIATAHGFPYVLRRLQQAANTPAT